MSKCKHEDTIATGRSLDVEWCCDCGAIRYIGMNGLKGKWRTPKSMRMSAEERVMRKTLVKREKHPWDELKIVDGRDKTFVLTFYSKEGVDDYVSEEWWCEDGETYDEAALRVCKKFGWDMVKPGGI